MISRKHAYVLLSVMLILIIVNHLCILDSFRAEMRKLSNKFTISSVLTEGDPVTAAQGDRKSTRLNSSHVKRSRMPSSA